MSRESTGVGADSKPALISVVLNWAWSDERLDSGLG